MIPFPHWRRRNGRSSRAVGGEGQVAPLRNLIAHGVQFGDK